MEEWLGLCAPTSSAQPPLDLWPVSLSPQRSVWQSTRRLTRTRRRQCPKGARCPSAAASGATRASERSPRTQSTKSHRRTGSRAEAKRASMLSKHTAFSSPMVSPRARPPLPLSVMSPVRRSRLWSVTHTRCRWRGRLCSVSTRSAGHHLLPTGADTGPLRHHGSEAGGPPVRAQMGDREEAGLAKRNK